MSSNSDMESVSISDVEMEEDEQVAPVTTSQPLPQAPAPVAGISLPQASSQPTPKRITMRERALAMREARLQKNKAKSTKKTPEAVGNNPKQNGTTEVQEGGPENGATASVPRQKLTPRKSPRSTSKVTLESAADPSRQESTNLASKHQLTDGKKPEAQGTAKGKKTNARKESMTKKSAKANTALTKPTETYVELSDTEEKSPHEPIPNGYSAPSRDDSQTSKAGSGTRKDQKKRKSTADPAEGRQEGDNSGSESDVILLQSRVVSPASPRARKKAKHGSAKPVASPKATSKSLKKKKETALPPLPVSTTIVAPVTIVPMDVQQNGHEAPPRKRKTAKKNARADVRVVDDDDEPIVVRQKRVSKSAADKPSKDLPAPGAVEQTPIPVPPKRRGRPRKYPKPDEPESQPQPTATMEEENLSKAKKNQDGSVPQKKTQRQTKPRGRKAKTVTPDEPESAKKSNVEDEGDFEVPKVKAASRQVSRSASKRRAPKQAASEQAHKQNEEHETPELMGTKKMGSKPTEAAGSEARGNEPSVNTVTQSPTKTKEVSVNEAALQSAKKSSRLAFALSSPRGTNVMQTTDLKTNASRRQSLTHQEGLSRLTSVVDQLQREGEAFLQTEHRICDQLVPFDSETANAVSTLPYENIGAPVSEDDRKAIADAALRDAVTHAKLEYQANHRAAISKLAENLVQAVKDWKNAKNAVLRDIIPEELRPKVEAPLQPLEQAGHNMEVMSEPQITEGTSDVPQENVHNENKKQVEGMDKDKEPETVSILSDEMVEARKKAIARIRVLENADAVRKYVGFSYSDLNIGTYRVCAILKLCEFDSGLSMEELYSKTPFGRSMLKKNVTALVDSKHLVEETIELAGEAVIVYRTAPSVITLG